MAIDHRNFLKDCIRGMIWNEGVPAMPAAIDEDDEGFADGCCTVETVTFFAGSGGQHAPTSTNGIHRDMAGDYRIS